MTNAHIGWVFGLVQGVLATSQTQAPAPNGVTGEPLEVEDADDVDH